MASMTCEALVLGGPHAPVYTVADRFKVRRCWLTPG